MLRAAAGAAVTALNSSWLKQIEAAVRKLEVSPPQVKLLHHAVVPYKEKTKHSQ